nr:unnamed protein product [Callosobruchus chinensis]
MVQEWPSLCEKRRGWRSSKSIFTR